MKRRPRLLLLLILALNMAALGFVPAHSDPVSFHPPYGYRTSTGTQWSTCDGGTPWLSSCSASTGLDGETGAVYGGARLVSPGGGDFPWFAYGAGDAGYEFEVPVPAADSIPVSAVIHVTRATASHSGRIHQPELAHDHAVAYVFLRACHLDLDLCFRSDTRAIAEARKGPETGQEQDVSLHIDYKDWGGGPVPAGTLYVVAGIAFDAALGSCSGDCSLAVLPDNGIADTGIEARVSSVTVG